MTFNFPSLKQIHLLSWNWLPSWCTPFCAWMIIFLASALVKMSHSWEPTQSNVQCLFLRTSCIFRVKILLHCGFALLPVLTPYNTRSFVMQCLIMACPCSVPPSAPLGSLIFTYCLCRFLGRMDNIIQTSSLLSPPPVITFSFNLTLFFLFHISSFSAFVSHAAAVQ